MLRNYFVVAFRTLTRNSIYSAINLAGLSIGIAASMLIGLWVIDEISYDRFHPNVGRLYQVWQNIDEYGEKGTWDDVPGPLYEELKTRQEVRNTAISDTNEGAPILLTAGDNRIYRYGRYVSPEFLEMFRFELIKGNASQVLDDPFSIVVTESTAKVLFAGQDPVNKIIKVNNGFDIKVTGVLKDLPSNSSFQFDFLLTFALYEKTIPHVSEGVHDWGSDAFAIYAELQPDADYEAVNREIRDLIKKDKPSRSNEPFLYPMTRWNLHGEFSDGLEAKNDRSDYIRGFTAIALGVLVIACINFMNLSTARSERRAREVGIRKIVGSRRRELIRQFLGESLFITTVAFLLALVLVELSMPMYNDLVQKQLFIEYASPEFWLCGVGIVVGTGLLSGSYPAFYLSAFNPVKVLKGKMHIGRNGILPRRLLVIFQFGFSILLIVGTVVVYQQMKYAQNRQLGYNKQNLITVPDNKELAWNYHVIKEELLQIGAVASMTKSNSPITEIYETNSLSWPENNGPELIIENIFAEYDYTKTMGIKLIEGRDFSPDIPTDSAAVILNQAAMDVIGFPKTIGSMVLIGGGPLKLIGITENVLMGSPYEKTDPMYIMLETKWVQQTHPKNITIRLESHQDLPAQLKKVHAVFKKYTPSYPFEFTFVDTLFNKNFKTIEIIGKLMNIFAFLAIFIASLGLFGLAAFTAERRTKEFGVRKVLGATVSSLVILISRDFIRLIVIAFVVSAPLAWWILSRFLERYPYRITMDWRLLPLAGCVVLVASLAIVASQAVRAALSNPVESLKSE